MINRENRHRLASALRQLIDGEITTDHFETLELGGNQDLAPYEIWNYASSLYHGLYPYRLRGSNALSPNDRQQLERCILFLKSDLEYRWPPYPRMLYWYVTFVVGVLLGVSSIVFSRLGFYLLAGVLYGGALTVILVVLLCSKKIEARKTEALWRTGEREVWPFLNRAEYEQAMIAAEDDSQ